jgi:putative inorganic carbon (HCO3(-)) transporter
MEWIIAIIISGIGIALAVARSTWLIDYAIFIFVFNRGIRRLVDFYFNHAFNPLSPISLTPLVIAGAMAVAWAIDFGRMPRWASRIFLCLGVGVVYAFVIGLIRVRLGAIYALGEVLAPISLAGFAFIRGADDTVRDRWMRSFAWGAILASAYGWYQYLTIPPWDAFWVQSVGFVGYLGQLEPTKMSVFSTMGERGPLAGYLGFAVVPMIISPRWRTFLSWPAVALVASVILLTTVRAGIVIAVIGTVAFLLVNRGAKLGQVLIAVVVLTFAIGIGFNRLPGYERIADRVSTLGNIKEDNSFRGRTEIMSGGFRAMFGDPLGAGLGAAGLGSRASTGTIQTTTTFGDAGYFQIFVVYGFIGTALFLWGLYLGWARLALYHRFKVLVGDHVMLARALMITMIPACWVGDVLTGFSPFWLALGCGLRVGGDRLTLAIAEQQAMLAALPAKRKKVFSRKSKP